MVLEDQHAALDEGALDGGPLRGREPREVGAGDDRAEREARGDRPRLHRHGRREGHAPAALPDSPTRKIVCTHTKI